MSTEREIQTLATDWPPRWAQSEQNWVVLMVGLAVPSFFLPLPINFIILWPAIRWFVLGDWRIHKLDDFPPQYDRLKVFSSAGRSVAAMLTFLALVWPIGWLATEMESLLQPLGTAWATALWLYFFYSLDFNRLMLSLRSRCGLAISAAPTPETVLESSYPLLSQRIVSGMKAFLLLNLGAYLGVAILARAYGLSTGWPPDSETTVMVWKGAAIALALLSAVVLPFLVDYRREHREGQIYLLAIGTVALAFWL